jgi:hypothetical protein
MRGTGTIQRSWLAGALFVLVGSVGTAAPFTINLSFGGGLSVTQEAIFTTAANTWMSLLPSYQSGINISALNISASGVAIDGAGGILGSAGPNALTTQGGFTLSTSGSMQFDTADLANMESSGSLLNLILHEMAHVMGFGTLWTNNGVYVNDTGQFTGPNALTVYRNEFNQPGATYVPVELGGGSGTANAHWNEVDGGGVNTGIVSARGDMRFEVMTGWLDPGSFISNTTVASFTDIGYVSAVPEPGTLFLLSGGLLVVGIYRRRSL